MCKDVVKRKRDPALAEPAKKEAKSGPIPFMFRHHRENHLRIAYCEARASASNILAWYGVSRHVERPCRGGLSR